MRRAPMALALVAAVALFGGCPSADICESNDDCTETGLEYCDVDSGECVECTEASHCDDGFTCTDFECVEVVVEDCTSNDDCTEAGAEYCDVDTGECVECLEDAHCDSGEECVANGCVEADPCDRTGIVAVDEEGFYAVTGDGPLVGYTAASAEDAPFDFLRVFWWFDYGANWDGVGVYPVETNSNMMDCGLCVDLYVVDSNGDIEKVFFAVEGEIEVTEIGADGEPFAAVLRNAILVEWNSNTDSAVSGGEVWCVDSHSWSVTFDGQLPCNTDDDCAEGLYCNTSTQQCVTCLDDSHCEGEVPVCNTTVGVCVECVSADDCDGDDICAGNLCLDISICGFEGFVPVDQEAASFDYFGTRLLFFKAFDEAGNELAIEMFGDGDPLVSFTPGTTVIGAEPNDQNYGTCTTCVLITANCDENDENCEHFFAVAGELVIEEIGEDDGEFFTGRLENAFFQQVTIDWGDTYMSTPVADGAIWCVDDMAFSTYLNVDCVSEADCDDPNLPYCSPAGACVACVTDEHCEVEGEECLDNVCMVPPDGNSCANPILIEEAGTHEGDLLGYTNYFSLSTTDCTGYSVDGQDVVFQVTLDPGQNIEVVYTLTGADGALYIVDECIIGEPPVDHAGVCLIGADETLSGEPETVEYTNEGAEAMTVYVVLDAYRAAADPEVATWDAVFTLSE